LLVSSGSGGERRAVSLGWKGCGGGLAGGGAEGGVGGAGWWVGGCGGAWRSAGEGIGR